MDAILGRAHRPRFRSHDPSHFSSPSLCPPSSNCVPGMNRGMDETGHPTSPCCSQDWYRICLTRCLPPPPNPRFVYGTLHCLLFTIPSYHMKPLIEKRSCPSLFNDIKRIENSFLRYFLQGLFLMMKLVTCAELK